MGYKINCVECNKPVGGEPRLLAGTKAGTGGGWGTICIPCVVELTKQSGVPSRMDKFILWYMENRVAAPTLKAENERLRVQMAQQANEFTKRMTEFEESLKEKYGIEIRK